MFQQKLGEAKLTVLMPDEVIDTDAPKNCGEVILDAPWITTLDGSEKCYFTMISDTDGNSVVDFCDVTNWLSRHFSEDVLDTQWNLLKLEIIEKFGTTLI